MSYTCAICWGPTDDSGENPTCNYCLNGPPKEEPKQVQATYYCPAPRHGWMQKPCACLEAIKDPGVADRGFEQVQAPEEVWVWVKNGVVQEIYEYNASGVAKENGGAVVRYVKAGGQ